MEKTSKPSVDEVNGILGETVAASVFGYAFSLSYFGYIFIFISLLFFSAMLFFVSWTEKPRKDNNRSCCNAFDCSAYDYVELSHSKCSIKYSSAILSKKSSNSNCYDSNKLADITCIYFLQAY